MGRSDQSWGFTLHLSYYWTSGRPLSLSDPLLVCSIEQFILVCLSVVLSLCIILSIYFCCVSVCRNIYAMKVRGLLLGVASLLSPYGFWESNSGPRAWCPALLPTVSSHQPMSVTVSA